MSEEVKACIFECPDCGRTQRVEQDELLLKYPSECKCGRKRGFKLIDRILVDEPQKEAKSHD